MTSLYKKKKNNNKIEYQVLQKLRCYFKYLCVCMYARLCVTWNKVDFSLWINILKAATLSNGISNVKTWDWDKRNESLGSQQYTLILKINKKALARLWITMIPITIKHHQQYFHLILTKILWYRYYFIFILQMSRLKEA